MFLLFLCVFGSAVAASLFTFQYVSIISLFHNQSPFFLQDLHSNMFLLFRFRSIPCRLPVFIYIPICFYYFGEFAVATDTGAAIYIPICFYYFPSNIALYNSTTILPSFVDPVIIFCFFNKIFSFFPKLCIFPAKRQLSTPRLFYLITGRQFSFYMNSPSVSNSSCIISPMPFPVSNSNSYLYVALWISITFRFLPLPIVFLSTFSGNF